MANVAPDVRLLIGASGTMSSNLVTVEAVPVRFNGDGCGASPIKQIHHLPHDPVNFLAGLRIGAEVSFAAGGELYGYTIAYRVVAPVGLERAQLMAARLRRIDGALARASEARGHPQ